MLFSSSFYICLAGSALPGKFVRKLVIIPRKSRLKGRGLVFFDYNFPIIPSLGFYTPPTGLVEETLVPQWSTAVCILWSRPWILWSGVNTKCSMTRFFYHLVIYYFCRILFAFDFENYSQSIRNILSTCMFDSLTWASRTRSRRLCSLASHMSLIDHDE